MARCLWRQGRRSARCPETPRLEGRTALVTGGGRGIGLETTHGLVARGAEVISASRTPHASSVPARFLPLDLADLGAVAKGVDALASLLLGRRIDVVVANAGLWPTRFARSAQGHEIAFATNALGHHALIRGLQARDLLAPGARVVVVTGDIYVMARECTADFAYRTAFGGQHAYCRSKLANLWQVRELAARHPELCALAVHPGVVASELAGSSRGVGGAIKRALLLSTEAGAQTSLVCATQPGLRSGAYYHNTLGRVEFARDDPAADAARAAACWELLEELTAPHRARGTA
jgi:NAD(P)-dependent dehydrogenase (short-subunit alcohol dehydrogenase family)